MSASASASAPPAKRSKLEKKEEEEEENEDMEGGLDGSNQDTSVLTLTAGDTPDGQGYKVPRKHALLSGLVKTSLEQDEKETKVDLPSVKHEILKEIVFYMEEQKGTSTEKPDKPLKSNKLKDVMKPKLAKWLEQLRDQHQQKLYDLTLAANYMEITCLLELCCVTVASLIKGQPLENLKDILDPKKKQ